jgi:hypothetical protein
MASGQSNVIVWPGVFFLFQATYALPKHAPLCRAPRLPLWSCISME